MAGGTIEITTDGSLVRVAVYGRNDLASHVASLTPEDAEALGQRLIEVSRIARLTRSVTKAKG